MTNVSNELCFLILNIRAYIGFKIKSFISFVLKGHVFRNKNFLDYLDS